MKKIGEQSKKKIMKVLVQISILMLIGIAVFCPVQAQDTERQIEGRDSVYVSGTYQPKAGTEKSSGSSSGTDEDGSFLNLYRSGKTAYYGAQLETENERRIYTVLAEKSRKGQIKSADSDQHSITVTFDTKIKVPAVNMTSSSVYRKFYNEVGKAIDAFLFDYSENYWIYGYRWRVLCSEAKSDIYGIKIWFTDYYSGIKSEANITEAELNRLLNKINGSSRYEIVKQAYEEVIKLVVYPSGENENYLPYHTITGGLLQKYGHKGVCDCYARIFKLLCQKKGIACILVPGGSEMVNGKVEVDHIWNYVQMENGKWYLVDCTWDDLGTDTPGMTHLLAGSQTPGFYSETVGENHLPAGRFTDSEYRPFTVPQLSTNAYTDQIQMETVPKKAALSKTSLILQEGEIKELSAKAIPETFPTDKLEWKCSDNNVISITEFGSAGKIDVTAKKAGKADITVSYQNKLLATCHVVVNAKKKAIVYKIKLNVSSLPLQVKKTTKALKVVSCSPGDRVKEWKSSNSRCVKVDKKTGKLTALRTGQATITVISQKGAKASCKITVQKGSVATKKLDFKKKLIELKKGKSQKLEVIRTPLTANDRLSYRSSNKKVVSVSASGTVKAKKKGTATITVRSSGGRTAKIKIKVK